MNKLIDAARKLFKRFHGHEPEADEIITLAATKAEPALYVGELVGVIYKAKDQEYIHEFKSTDRPGLYVSSDGQQAYIVAGRYVFTERGFID